MRRFFAGLGVGLLLVAAGCNHWPHTRNDVGTPVAAAPPALEPARLVAYLNGNADKVKAVQCTRVAMDCKEGNQGVGVDGMLVCEKDRKFRLKGSVMGKPAVDLGSNDDEFWYWISQVKPVPYVYHCSYAELGRGNVRLDFPFQPDMIIAALGISHYKEDGKYQVAADPRKNYFELVEDAVSPQGQPVKKVTVFNKNRVDTGRGQPQVIAHVLKDAQGKVLCQATIHEVQVKNDVILPRKLTLSWPAQQMKIEMILSDLTVVNNLPPQRAAVLFNRTDLSNLPSFDLARRAPDGAPSPLMRASVPAR